MDYRLLKEWQKEVNESRHEKTEVLINRLRKSKPLFEKPYLQWMFDITPMDPNAYYDSNVAPRIFPELWATLPFYKLNVVSIPIRFRNKRDFRQYFGMDVETFRLFCEYGRIRPMVSSPTRYKNQHFLDPILRESPPVDTISHSLNAALFLFVKEKLGITVVEEAMKLFPRDNLAKSAYSILTIWGYPQITSEIVKLLNERKIQKRIIGKALYFTFFYYIGPLLFGGGGTHILTEEAAEGFAEWGIKTTRPTIHTEIREDLLEWLGFRLPRTIDRKYISKYIEICENLSPSLHKVVLKIENKSRKYENARDELKILLANLEGELELITKRRKTMAGAFKWLSAFPLSIAEDYSDKLGFRRTREDLGTAKIALKDSVAEKVANSVNIGELIAAITRKGYVVRNVWKIKEKTKEL